MVGDPQRWTGRILDGRYHVGARLGQGGMGSVYVAEHVGLSQARAVKFLHEDLAQRPDATQRFIREARILALLQHDHIIDVVDVGQCEGIAYYVMELLSGEDLRAVLTREGSLSWARTRELALQICDALATAHAKGIIHRDMKPENCFCVRREDAADFIKVLDFGIAKVGENKFTATGEMLGTVYYMPPEQLEGGGDRRVDVYAVGVMIYEMLSGRLPFEGPGYEVLTKLVRGTAPPRLAQVCPGVSSELEAVVMRAMALAPAERFEDMRSMRAALAALPAEGLVTRAAPKQPVDTPSSALDPRELGNLPTELPGASALAVGGSGRRTLGDLPTEVLGASAQKAQGSLTGTPARPKTTEASDFVAPRAPTAMNQASSAATHGAPRPVAISAIAWPRWMVVTSRAAIASGVLVLAVWIGWSARGPATSEQESGSAEPTQTAPAPLLPAPPSPAPLSPAPLSPGPPSPGPSSPDRDPDATARKTQDPIATGSVPPVGPPPGPTPGTKNSPRAPTLNSKPQSVSSVQKALSNFKGFERCRPSYLGAEITVEITVENKKMTALSLVSAGDLNKDKTNCVRDELSTFPRSKLVDFSSRKVTFTLKAKDD